MILNEIDKSLHHDEVFVLNRIEASWQEMVSEDTGNMSNKNDPCNNITEDKSSTGDITKHAYWLEMGEKERKKFHDGQLALQNKRLKINRSKTSRTTSTVGLSTQEDKEMQPVYFHYMYFDENNQPSTSVEKRFDGNCPFCDCCCKSNEQLLIHCGVFHGALLDFYPWKELLDCGLTFQAVLDEDKHLHIVVKSFGCAVNTKDATDNFTFVRPPSSFSKIDSIPFLLRSHKNVAVMDALTRRRRLLALESNDAPASVISSYLPTDEVPIRQYFHSRTNLPLEDWNSIDSDDEPDEEWLNKMSSDLIGEFEDISDKEKKFMQMWNRFIKCHIVVADRDIPEKCQEFIRSHIKELKAGGMRKNLLLHLMNLWDSGVISSNRILACLSLYDKGVAELGSIPHSPYTK
jgi:hypothetical protein